MPQKVTKMPSEFSMWGQKKKRKKKYNLLQNTQFVILPTVLLGVKLILFTLHV